MITAKINDLSHVVQMLHSNDILFQKVMLALNCDREEVPTALAKSCVSCFSWRITIRAGSRHPAEWIWSGMSSFFARRHTEKSVIRNLEGSSTIILVARLN